MIFFGRIQWAKADSYSLVKTRTANLRVHWAGDTLPPDVFVGYPVCAAGRVKSYNGGRDIFVVDAVPIPGGRKELQKFMKLLKEVCADPSDWAPEVLDGRRRRG